VKQIKAEIDKYTSNMGGTNIYEPLKYIIEKYLIDFSFIPKDPYTEQINYVEDEEEVKKDSFFKKLITG
jgi:hypothetical protein